MRDSVRTLSWLVLWGVLGSGCGAPDPVPSPVPHDVEMVKAVDLLEHGDAAGAIPLLVHVVEQVPSNSVAWINLGSAYALAGESPPALAAFAQAATLDRADTRALELAAQLEMKAGHWREARVLLDQANRREGYSPRILTSMGVVEYRAGNLDMAEAFLSQALQADEHYGAALYNAGVVQRDGRKDMARAAAYFEGYLAQAGQDDTRAADLQAFVAQHGVAPKAPTAAAPVPIAVPTPVPVAVPTVAVTAPPASVAKALALSKASIDRKAYEEALVTLKQAIEKSEDPDLLWRLAEVYGVHLGMSSKAAATYKRFAAAYPDDARVALIPGPVPAAPVKAKPSASQAPTVASAETGAELWTQALAAHRRNESARALVLYKQAVAKDPTLFGAWHNLGLVAKTEGDLATAQQAFEKALALRPDWSDARFMLAVVLHERGDDDHAAELLDELLIGSANHVKAHYLLAVIHAKANSRGLARTHFEHVRRLDGDGEFGLQARDWLKENERTSPPQPKR
ncbi:MAG: tetratricopeptide repeat protein [Lentisphaerae bacterium]|nr:tetratricopeptide repeat protein [Lentisphaerota bacterium]